MDLNLILGKECEWLAGCDVQRKTERLFKSLVQWMNSHTYGNAVLIVINN